MPSLIDFRPAKADALLGVRLSPEFDEKTLAGMGCVVDKKGNAPAWKVSQPSWRPDLTREADLIEEVGRVYGLDTIPAALAGGATGSDARRRTGVALCLLVAHQTLGRGPGLERGCQLQFRGSQGSGSSGFAAKGPDFDHEPPLGRAGRAAHGPGPGLLQDLRNNLAQGAQGLRLFELAHIFEADPASETTARETGALGILLYGARHDAAWPHPAADMNYTDIKGIVEHLLHFLHLPAPICEKMEAHPFLLPCVKMRINGRRVGFMGRVKPILAEDFHARKDVWLAELNLDVLREMHDQAVIRFRPLPVYPPVRRDITLMAGPGLKVGQVLDHLAGLDLPLLEEVALADCFEPDSGPDDAPIRNLTFRLTFRHAEPDPQGCGSGQGAGKGGRIFAAGVGRAHLAQDLLVPHGSSGCCAAPRPGLAIGAARSCSDAARRSSASRAGQRGRLQRCRSAAVRKSGLKSFPEWLCRSGVCLTLRHCRRACPKTAIFAEAGLSVDLQGCLGIWSSAATWSALCRKKITASAKPRSSLT